MMQIISWLFLVAILVWAVLSLFGVAAMPNGAWTFIALGQFLALSGIPAIPKRNP